MILPLIAAKVGFRSSRIVLEWPTKSLTDGLIRKYCMPAGVPGSGAGRGGGAGGSIREAGGGMGRFQTAQEEGYFHNKEKEKLKKLKKDLEERSDTELKKTDDKK